MNKVGGGCYTINVITRSVQSGRIGADEVIDDTDGKGAEELEERLKEKEAKTQAILLEMVRRESALSFLLNIPKVQRETFLHRSVPRSCRWATSPTQMSGLQRMCCLCANLTR